DSLKGVVSADGVHEEEDGHKEVGGCGENNASEVEDDQRRSDENDGDVFGPPGRSGVGMDGSPGEDGEVGGEEELGSGVAHVSIGPLFGGSEKLPGDRLDTYGARAGDRRDGDGRPGGGGAARGGRRAGSGVDSESGGDAFAGGRRCGGRRPDGS